MIARLFLATVGLALPSAAVADAVTLDAVLASVRNCYPPYLAALIERDIATGRTTQALGAFDTQLKLGGGFVPEGYYDGTSEGYAALEQPLTQWGGSVYGGYRYSSGFLPDYYKGRTQEGGEAMVGFSLPLLQDGTIDKRRAELFKARIDQELADPVILRQHLDFIRDSSLAYFDWVAAGFRLGLTEQLLDNAKNRQAIVDALVERGAQAPIVRTDNERLVVSRQLSLVSAQRKLEAAAIKLSLFYRGSDDEPIRLPRTALPGTFPPLRGPDQNAIIADLAKARIFRPEIRRIELMMEKNGIDQQLARNQLLPKLNLAVEASQSVGDPVYNDINDTELKAQVQFSLPLQRREAKGQITAADAAMERLQTQLIFARDSIDASVYDAFSALKAARSQIVQTDRNVALANELEKAEAARFEQGAADLLALQIREQATFDARQIQVEANADFFRALAFYRAAVAADAPRSIPASPK